MAGKREGVWNRNGIIVDTTYWPMLVEVMPPDFPNDDPTLDAWMAHVDEIMKANASPFVMVVDALATRTSANAQSRKRMADWMSHSEPYQTHCLGVVFVVASPLVRGALTAINWLTRPRPPRVIVGTWSEAVNESRTLLGRAGLNAPVGIERYLSKVAV